MEAYIWLILASMLAVGILVGFFMGRSKGDTSAPKVQELEEGIVQAKQEMQEYRSQVTDHFEKTANLFNQLTNDYREVYEHLANSSEELCGDQVAKLKSLTAETKVLGEKVVSQDTEAVNDTKAAEEEKSEAAASTEETNTEETSGSVSVDENTSAESETKDVSDSAPAVETTDKKAD